MNTIRLERLPLNMNTPEYEYIMIQVQAYSNISEYEKLLVLPLQLSPGTSRNIIIYQPTCQSDTCAEGSPSRHRICHLPNISAPVGGIKNLMMLTRNFLSAKFSLPDTFRYEIPKESAM
jgi:hypothetical protein